MTTKTRTGGSRAKLTPAEFLELWNQQETVEGFAAASGYTVESAKSKKNELARLYEWDFKRLINQNGKRAKVYPTKTKKQKQATVPPSVGAVDPGCPLGAAYAAAVLDCCGKVTQRVVIYQNGTTRQKLSVKITITTNQAAVVHQVQNVFGGEVKEFTAGDTGTFTSYQLSWSQEDDLHKFLTAVLPYSVRFKNDLAPVVQWLELSVLLRYQELELINALPPEN